MREFVETGQLEVEKIDTDKNPADIFTKGLDVAKFYAFALKLFGDGSGVSNPKA